MSNSTWNFPTWQCHDKGLLLTRATAGGAFTVDGPLPFTTSIMGVFSFLIRSDYTANSAEPTAITSIGANGGTDVAFGAIINHNSAGNSFLGLQFYDTVGGAYRLSINVGDEDGINWLQEDKWYQIAFTADGTALNIVVNGSTTYTTTGFGAAGDLSLDQGAERWWHSAPVASWPAGTPFFVGSYWPSVVLGPSAWEATTQDLTTAAVRDRIFDADGNFKDPGPNGSRWMNDAYTTTAGYSPDQYFNDGSPRFANGSHALTWVTASGGGWNDAPGTLRKSYE